MANATITKTSMMNLLTSVPVNRNMDLDTWQSHVVGRALVAIFKRQTRDEQSSHTTNQNNNIGFAGCDAKAGSFGAKSYMKRNTLLEWQLAKWMSPGRDGFPRITKYHRQLNEIAAENAA